MFSGIVEEIGVVVSLSHSRLIVRARVIMVDLKPGDSIAVNGVCLTATEIIDGVFKANVMPETLRRTNLGELRPGDQVNLERALTLSGRIGGHLVQGHIDATGTVNKIIQDGDAKLMTISAPPEVMRYIVEKGFITVDGLSLTVTNLAEHHFSVSLVAFSQSHTTIGGKQEGDRLNLEADIIAKYVEKFTSKKTASINEAFLTEHGFA
ncbi:riboflavin synthase [Dehalogenimonas alkenigignens]|uniref:Riboflavin synthase n=1 Tax=Dehalogenimonas alkenigignens TaxID=1217799 RepID=A0A0W0GIF4_9CHLR|nr:riboflavin synthase [Dehalogenimonas alkenigignens]KTB48325.1 riboflavin synthase alpha chain [Dehalogenimonas alkenigignens]PVV85205.1 riboflavin synthase [Dehalogenimonas alkenigignens]